MRLVVGVNAAAITVSRGHDTAGSTTSCVNPGLRVLGKPPEGVQKVDTSVESDSSIRSPRSCNASKLARRNPS